MTTLEVYNNISCMEDNAGVIDNRPSIFQIITASLWNNLPVKLFQNTNGNLLKFLLLLFHGEYHIPQ